MLRALGFSLIAATALAGLANAGSTYDPIRKDVQVSYSDLNLNSETDAHVMLTRIASAAKEACGGSPYFYSYYSAAPAFAQHEFAVCKAEAIQRAVASLRAPTVTKLYAMNGAAQAPRLASY